jgi:hypothetical protein
MARRRSIGPRSSPIVSARPLAARAEKAAADDLAKRREQENSSAHFRERERRAGFEIWHEALPHAGSLVDGYLALRGIAAPRDAKLRFSPNLPYFDRPKDQGGVIIHEGPAMVAAIILPDGHA